MLGTNFIVSSNAERPSDLYCLVPTSSRTRTSLRCFAAFHRFSRPVTGSNRIRPRLLPSTSLLFHRLRITDHLICRRSYQTLVQSTKNKYLIQFHTLYQLDSLAWTYNLPSLTPERRKLNRITRNEISSRRAVNTNFLGYKKKISVTDI